MKQFDYCKINYCFELVKPVHILLGTNFVTVLLLQILERNQSYSKKNQIGSFLHKTFYKKLLQVKVITSRNLPSK